MYIVTVEFVVWPKHVEEFHRAMQQQARNSLNLEADCHQFDVCLDPQDGEKIFLYEVYTDEAAFKAHLETDHFLNFDATVRDWVKRKTVQFWIRSQA
jgi:autoinducer 2-degrading protein